MWHCILKTVAGAPALTDSCTIAVTARSFFWNPEEQHARRVHREQLEKAKGSNACSTKFEIAKRRSREHGKSLEDWNIIIDSISRVLRYTFRNPCDAPDLLLLQLEERIERCQRELL